MLARRPVLPTEVCERIIDFVAEEYLLISRARRWQIGVLETLQACALTCSAWTPRSQLHLFRFLGVQCAKDSKKNVDEFFTLLERNQALQSYVESLCFSAEVDGTTLLHVLPLRATQLASEVKQLTLMKGTVCTPCASLFSICMRQFRAVTQLVLWDVAFRSVHDLRRVIDALHALDRLNMTRVTWQFARTPTTPTTYPRTKTRLERLWFKSDAAWLKDEQTIYFIEWLARSGLVSCLRRADFHHAMFVSDKMVTAVQTLLQACAESVQEVILSLGPEVDFSTRKSANITFDLIHNSERLQVGNTISLCHRLYWARFRCAFDSRAITRLVDMLNNVSQISFATLFLPFDEFPACQKANAQDWAALDGALQRAPWNSLKRIQVLRATRAVDDPVAFVWGNTYLEGPLEGEKWVEEVREGLPLATKQGKVWCATEGHRQPRPIGCNSSQQNE